MLRLPTSALLATVLASLPSCNVWNSRVPTEERAPSAKVEVNHPGLPLATLTEAELDRFKQGDALFEATFRESDGLGPLYVRDACSACHAADGRGPGLVTKVAALDDSHDTAAELLPFGPTERPYVTAGAKTPLLAAQHPRLRVTPRLPPAVFGRGYLEAIADHELERLERLAQARPGSARGRLNRLKSGAIGRFGIKARLATLEDFTVDALSGDMGISSPGRPDEPAGPEGLKDDRKHGVDVTHAQVELIRDYLRGLEIPVRRGVSQAGQAHFTSARCHACHVASLTTAADYPVKALAGVQAHVYTDLLLHDMGAAASDGQREESAGPREFRTAPLIGLRFLPSFMHDGRAHSVEEAILAHGDSDSEARDSVLAFKALPETARQELVKFVEAL